MEMSERGRRLLTEWEGVSLLPYQDSGGKWTIGVGHLLTQRERSSGDILINGEVVSWKQGITRDQADALLQNDLKSAEDGVELAVVVPLTENQADALISFTFNVGVSAFANSTLCRYVNEEEFGLASHEFAKWCHAGGRVIQGLVNRREHERALFIGELV